VEAIPETAASPSAFEVRVLASSVRLRLTANPRTRTPMSKRVLIITDDALANRSREVRASTRTIVSSIT